MTLRQLVPLAALLVLAAARPVSAEPGLTAFGPHEYIRDHGEPKTATDHFAVCSPGRAFRLRVKNGPGRHRRASEGVIRLNGVAVVHPHDLHRQARVIERPVTLQAQNTLSVRLGGRPGSAVVVSILARTPCAPIAFTAPAPAAVVPTGLLPVEGTMFGAPEAGVVVNGVRAAVQGERFAALVPVAVDVTELVAVATLPDGTTREARLAVTVTPAPESPLLVRAMPAGGAAPLTVRFTLVAQVPAAQLRLDLGDGRSATNPSLETETFTYDQPGLYFPTVTVTDPDGAAHTGTAFVVVVDRPAFDAQLRARWTAMKDALRVGDLARALDGVAMRARDDYREMLSALTVLLDRID